MKNPKLREQKLAPKMPMHAYSEEALQNLRECIAAWNPKLEDGSPCSDCRQSCCFTDEEVEWKKLLEIKAKNSMTMEDSRWLQFVHYLFPEIALVRPKEDE